MLADITNLNQIGVLRGVLGQEIPAITPSEPPAVRLSYEEAHRRLFSSCKSMMSEGDCIKLIGSSPFVCDTVTSKVWFWLAAGVGAGLALSRVLGR